jgi:hypothetical protein
MEQIESCLGQVHIEREENVMLQKAASERQQQKIEVNAEKSQQTTEGADGTEDEKVSGEHS